MSDTITRSNEVIVNLRKANGGENASSYAYSYAFGWAWGMLSEKERKRMLKMAEEMLERAEQQVTEKEEN